MPQQHANKGKMTTEHWRQRHSGQGSSNQPRQTAQTELAHSPAAGCICWHTLRLWDLPLCMQRRLLNLHALCGQRMRCPSCASNTCLSMLISGAATAGSFPLWRHLQLLNTRRKQVSVKPLCTDKTNKHTSCGRYAQSALQGRSQSVFFRNDLNFDPPPRGAPAKD